MFDLISGAVGVLASQFFGIVIGAVIMFVFLVLVINHKIKTNPEWTLAKLAKYAAKAKPAEDWVNGYIEIFKKKAAQAKYETKT